MNKEIPVNLVREMKQSYMDYSMSVIVGRALPDVRDGFKPVHRRILYAMFDEGLLSNRRYSKCAGVVGEVLKKYHPHGDSAVYDALVRLAQEWVMRYCLVDGQGNFGSVDGDRAAAYRYTEARMRAIAEDMLADIDKDTVDWLPNFDEQTQEPLVLPTRYPNLLVNGSSGIAVGMATNIPPHNIREIGEAFLALVKNPGISVHALMDIVKGPDFPTGGIICGRQGICDAYETGKGKLIVRAKTHFEKYRENARDRIVVDEIPYMVNKAKVLEKIAELVKDQRIEGIADIRDESDRHGMRICVDLKKGEIPEVILNQMFQMTTLQSTFGVIMLALVDQEPRILNLKEMLSQFADFRRDVVRRRTTFLLNKAERRAHILEGFVKALDVLDALIALIRASDTPATAKAAMMERWAFSQDQAQAILEMRLQKLTGMEREAIVAEYASILEEIKGLKRILEEKAVLKAVLISEIEEVMQKYGDDRRTEILEVAGAFRTEDLIADETVVITRSHRGYVKRTPLDTYRAQRRGGKGRMGMKTHDDDFVEDLFVASNHDQLMVFTNLGRVYCIKVYEIPQTDAATKGKAIVNLLELGEGEVAVAFHAVREFAEDVFLVFITKNGVVKKTSLAAYQHIRSVGIIAINIRPDDELLSVAQTDGAQEIFMATKKGKAIRFSEEDLRPMGRAAAGVKGIALAPADEVVGVAIIPGAEEAILTVSENGFGKRTPVREYRFQKRGGSGTINMKITEKTGPVVGVRHVTENHSVLVITLLGKLIRMDLSNVRSIGRATQGVRLILLDDAEDRVVDIGDLPPEDEAEKDAGGGEAGGLDQPAGD